MFFAKVYVPNWSDEVFEIKKVQNTCRGHMLLAIIEAKKLLERFTKKKIQKANQKEYRVEKKKYDKLYIKWKSSDSFFNS